MQRLSKYIQKTAQKSSYAISYSGFKGAAFNQFSAAIHEQIQVINRKMRVSEPLEKEKLIEERYDLSNQINPSFLRIINEKGIFHRFAEAIHKFDKGNENTQRLYQLLYAPFKAYQPMSYIPTYRDAIVFYDSNDWITGILHICFGCDMMLNEKEKSLRVDGEVFWELRKLFLKLGHQIN